MCGLIGIIGTPYAAKESYLGLLMLQHRGQDSAGILSFDPYSKSFHSVKNLGEIKAAIPESRIESLRGTISLGHTRYSTIGSIREEEIQPMVMNYPYGIAMAHNGNIVNAEQVKNQLLKDHKRMSLSKNDLEAMMNTFAEGLSKDKGNLNEDVLTTTLESVYSKVKGGYSSVGVIADHGLVAFKDPNGIRPLCWGRRKLTDEEKKLDPSISHLTYSYAVASESKSLSFLGYEDIEELEQSEFIFITHQGEITKKVLKQRKLSPCMFEWIYFANADSKIWNKSVYQLRLKFGELLGEKLLPFKDEIDIVVPVPDTARPSAITISEKLNVPYREVLIKNRYAQRTFILNTQQAREKAVQLKMNVIKEEVEGKSILLVDDSIVRGTTSKKIIQLLKANGAKKVMIASTCPPIIKPCFYGIDFPEENQLIASNKSFEQIANTIRADSAFFLEVEELKKAFDGLNVCMACLNGDYPVDIDQAQEMINSRINHENTSLPGIS